MASRRDGIRLAAVVRELAVGLAVALAAGAAAAPALGLSPAHLSWIGALYAVQAGMILRMAPAHLSGPGLGAANRVTLVRSGLVLPVAALALVPGVPGEAARWAVIVLATLALLLDGVDGAVARRTGSASGFGARYDMELDAFLMLALSLLVWESGRAGAWVILIGALRYLFVAAGTAWPALAEPLPPSFRRRVVCVVQGVALLVALGPIVAPALAVATVAAALALLVGSFGADVAWLVRRAARHRRVPPDPLGRVRVPSGE